MDWWVVGGFLVAGCWVAIGGVNKWCANNDNNGNKNNDTNDHDDDDDENATQTTKRPTLR